MALSRVRKVVSGQRHRFISEEEGFNLDLTYITERIIAMGFPSTGVESAYRNDVVQVSHMLRTYHRDHFHIFNLTERVYDYSKFDGRVAEFGWPDHQSPPLELLFRAVSQISDWLSAHPQNVAVVHCKAGKGRTGTLVACLLLWLRAFDKPGDALEYFSRRRSSRPDSKSYLNDGVTIPSQKRYVGYFHALLNGYVPATTPVVLARVLFSDIPKIDSQGGCRPYLKIFTGDKHDRELFTNKEGSETHGETDGGMKIELMAPLTYGDVLLKFKHKGKMANAVDMFHCAFHTSFVDDTYLIRLPKSELDKGWKDKRIPEDMVVDLIFERPQTSEQDTQGRPSFQAYIDRRNSQIKQEAFLAANPGALPHYPALPTVTLLHNDVISPAMAQSQSPLSGQSISEPLSSTQSTSSSPPSPLRIHSPPRPPLHTLPTAAVEGSSPPALPQLPPAAAKHRQRPTSTASGLGAEAGSPDSFVGRALAPPGQSGNQQLSGQTGNQQSSGQTGNQHEPDGTSASGPRAGSPQRGSNIGRRLSLMGQKLRKQSIFSQPARSGVDENGLSDHTSILDNLISSAKDNDASTLSALFPNEIYSSLSTPAQISRLEEVKATLRQLQDGESSEDQTDAQIISHLVSLSTALSQQIAWYEEERERVGRALEQLQSESAIVLRRFERQVMMAHEAKDKADATVSENQQLITLLEDALKHPHDACTVCRGHREGTFPLHFLSSFSALHQKVGHELLDSGSISEHLSSSPTTSATSAPSGLSEGSSTSSFPISSALPLVPSSSLIEPSQASPSPGESTRSASLTGTRPIFPITPMSRSDRTDRSREKTEEDDIAMQAGKSSFPSASPALRTKPCTDDSPSSLSIGEGAFSDLSSSSPVSSTPDHMDVAPHARPDTPLPAGPPQSNVEYLGRPEARAKKLGRPPSSKSQSKLLIRPDLKEKVDLASRANRQDTQGEVSNHTSQQAIHKFRQAEIGKEGQSAGDIGNGNDGLLSPSLPLKKPTGARSKSKQRSNLKFNVEV